MIPFRDFRNSLQNPRKTADAWYGKWIMRRVSIYVTWLFVRLGLGPNLVTFLSLLFALMGIASLAAGKFGIGILALNFWYLLDHVDGELARLRNVSSLSGTFFDTVINFLVQPFTFLGWSIGLAPQMGWQTLFWGMAAASGSLMLMAIPMTEEAVLFNQSIKTKVTFQRSAAPNSLGIEKERSIFRRIYGFIHTLVTYPWVLVFMTLECLIFLIIKNNSLVYVFSYRFLILYAFLATVVWISQLVYKVYFQTLDRSWKPVSGI